MSSRRLVRRAHKRLSHGRERPSNWPTARYWDHRQCPGLELSWEFAAKRRFVGCGARNEAPLIGCRVDHVWLTGMIAPIAFEAMTMLVKWKQYRFVRSDLLLIDEG